MNQAVPSNSPGIGQESYITKAGDPGTGREYVERSSAPKRVLKPYNGRGTVWFWLLIGTVDMWLGAAGLGAGKSNFYIGFVILGAVLLIMAADLELQWKRYEDQRESRGK
jgi:hypothetical protein